MPEIKVNVFLIPQEKSSLPKITYDEKDLENDPSYLKILDKINKTIQETLSRKKTRCDVSIEVERQKIIAISKLLEKRGYSVFVQGVLL